MYSKGKSAAGSLLVVYCRKNGSVFNRIGFTVGTKLGKAVIRNKVRRRLRAIYRLHETELSRGYDIIVVARVKSRYALYSDLEKEYLSLCGRVGLMP